MIYLFYIVLVFLSPVRAASKLRDSNGIFRSPNQEELKPIIPLSKEVMDPLNGNLLGDGSLQKNKKGLDGLPKPSSNANFVITLKTRSMLIIYDKTFILLFVLKQYQLLDLNLKLDYQQLNIILNLEHYLH